MINKLSSRDHNDAGEKKSDRIKEAIENNLDPSRILLIESSLDLMDNVQDKIDKIDTDLKRKMSTRHKT